jgi:hypothetical protein
MYLLEKSHRVTPLKIDWSVHGARETIAAQSRIFPELRRAELRFSTD